MKIENGIQRGGQKASTSDCMASHQTRGVEENNSSNQTTLLTATNKKFNFTPCCLLHPSDSISPLKFLLRILNFQLWFLQLLLQLSPSCIGGCSLWVLVQVSVDAQLTVSVPINSQHCSNDHQFQSPAHSSNLCSCQSSPWPGPHDMNSPKTSHLRVVHIILFDMLLRIQFPYLKSVQCPAFLSIQSLLQFRYISCSLIFLLPESLINFLQSFYIFLMSWNKFHL